MSCRPLVAELAERGLPTRDIAAAAGVSTQRVQVIRRQLGLVLPRPRIDAAKLAGLHREGIGCVRAARIMGHTVDAVRQAARRLGLPPLERWTWSKRRRAPAVHVRRDLAAIVWDKVDHAARSLAPRYPDFDLDELRSFAAVHVPGTLEAMATAEDPEPYAYTRLRWRVQDEIKRERLWRGRLAQ